LCLPPPNPGYAIGDEVLVWLSVWSEVHIVFLWSS